MVQVGHVCIEAGREFLTPDNSFLVLCSVENEEELLAVEEYLGLRGIKSVKFWEPDDNMGWTALATQPVSGKDRKVFKRFQLWNTKNIVTA